MLINTQYFIVPNGKNLYFDNITQSGVSCQIYSDGTLLDLGSQPQTMEELILTEGDSVLFSALYSWTGWIWAYGYLVDVDSNMEIVNIILDSNSPTYTVPGNKKIIIDNCITEGIEDLTIILPNNQSVTGSTNFPSQAAYFSPGTIIQPNANPNSADPMYYLMSGYLIDN
tara:strand:+ start:25 stop:534 length:510 start_codon:yes stop_codon:yes gene_type:complete